LRARRLSSLAEYDLARRKRELLKKLGHRIEALESAWADFNTHSDKYSYEELMRYVPKTDRASWHARAMDAAAGGPLASVLELWLETKETDRLVARVHKASDAELESISHYVTEPIARRLARTHAEAAAKIYRSLGMRILKAGKSKYYYAALSHFEEAKRCYHRAGLDVEWQELAKQVRASHHRKKAFIVGFERIVAGVREIPKPTFLEQARARWLRGPGR
jgi:hypothetical protein